MKRKINPIRGLLMCIALQCIMLNPGFSQDCSGLTATVIPHESRCTATGSLEITATGGSGTYNYKVQGASTSDFTSSNLITGLLPGTYSVIVKDIVTNCSFQLDNIIVPGFYSDPRFGISETDVTCMNGNDGSISIAGLINGRGPFTFSIVSPSPSGVGTSNATGNFTGLTPGSYFIQLTDSCGGIQTRNISIQNYNWTISAAPVSQLSCTGYHVQIALTDSKGRDNSSGTAFNGFQYGFVNGPGDTIWSAANAFDFDLAQKRTATFVVKDLCGLVQTKSWVNPAVPSVQASVALTGATCAGFTATITGQQNLTAPIYCLTDNLGNPVTGQACNSAGIFTGIPYGSYCIQITNTCYDTVITRCFTLAQPVPAITGSVALSNYTCTDFQAAVTGQQNLTNPQYCLLDNSGSPVSGVPCNSTGIFPNLPYGSYKIQVTDGCSGTIINLNFSAAKKTKSVGATITTNNFTCATFDASVTGQSNLTTPQYCLVDNLGNPITCNSTGIFPGLSYGSYCINITDACADTTIQRCFSATPPPASGGSATITNKTCTGFTITITGQLNVFNGLYCLQDNLGNPVSGVPCNSTGIFTDIPYGSYCVKTTDGCSGTTLTTCFTVAAPAPAVGPAVISNITCTGFTATITGQQNLTNPNYCLFDSLNSPVGSCNNTGVFAITGFGPYQVTTTDGCGGSVFTTNFSVYAPVPSVGATVNFTDQTCTTFTATITGQSNLNNPHYYLKDNFGGAVDDNLTGLFTNIAYGSYCIDIVNGCLDTTITRCFTVAPVSTQMNVTATPSCLYDASDLNIAVTAGFAPYTISVYDNLNVLISSTNSNSNQISITGLPALTAGNQYKVVVTGTCGTPAVQFVTGQQSMLSHVYQITPKCPSSINLSGSGDLTVTGTTNLGTLNMSIIQKNGTPVSIPYSFHSGNDFTFNNLDAATYIIAYTFSGCSTVINDTVSIPNYTFPALAPSGAYQCDNNSFSVGAAVTGGMSPYTYQIIGSQPVAPSINSAPQSNPVFTISNGQQYSLVRLRAVDACGNATLNDVSILPLANTIVTATSNCIYKATTLSTDFVANATYTWFKKDSMSATDSVLVGTSPTYSIPAISVSDTGIYVNRMSVNNGCLTKLSYFHLDGMCNGLFTLPASVILHGKSLTATANQLSWDAPDGGQVNTYVIERADGNGSAYHTVGSIVSKDPTSSVFTFTDNITTAASSYYYRIRIVTPDNGFGYSNVVVIGSAGNPSVRVYPNPVTDILNIEIPGNDNSRYLLKLINVAGQVIFAGQEFTAVNGRIQYHRDPKLKTGLYFLQILDSKGTTLNTFKLEFK